MYNGVTLHSRHDGIHKTPIFVQLFEIIQILFFWFNVKKRQVFIFITNLFFWKISKFSINYRQSHLSTLFLKKRYDSIRGKNPLSENDIKLFGHNFVNNGRRVARIWHNMRYTMSILYSKSFKNRQCDLSVFDPETTICALKHTPN